MPSFCVIFKSEPNRLLNHLTVPISQIEIPFVFPVTLCSSTAESAAVIPDLQRFIIHSVNQLHGGSFTGLIDSGDDASLVMAEPGSFIFPAENALKMLCFENLYNHKEKAFDEYGVKETKEWSHQKATQAAEKLSLLSKDGEGGNPESEEG
ncbi:hypothetical protein NE237_000951 [Protea cynaroides]|uniref:Uncharacterized protein n=1 Tax=Protea cynaroides TaxID=273540 RepID=A0A9Q0KSF5_9MAGN|nr:hypothetical protein NE237_000951 [Protea cynaroides]